MHIDEIKHRDHVLRDYFKGRDWDRNNEYLLKQKLIRCSDRLLPEYQYVIEDEWEVDAGRADQGCGDLIFTDGLGNFAVVEVKWIDVKSSGSTATNKRTKKRKAVKEQAISYATIYKEKNLSAVKQLEAYTYTNEYDKPQRQ